MKIAVLLKKTLDSEAQVHLSDDRTGVDYSGLSFVINPYDEIAVEEAVRIKEKNPSSTEVVVISFSDLSCKELILKALAMGADRGVLIQNSNLESAPSSVVAEVLSSVLREEKPDLILCGKCGIDDANMQVGLMVAEYLDIPSVASVSKLDILVESSSCIVEKTADGGEVEVYELKLPALCGTDRVLNQPRYAALSGIMKAKKKTLEIKTAEDFGLSISQLKNTANHTSVSYSYPPQRQLGKIIKEEDLSTSITKLVELLHDEAGVI